MDHRESTKPSGQVQTSVAVRELIDRDSGYDTSTIAWAEFDRQMTSQIARLENELRRYFTPTASRKELGR